MSANVSQQLEIYSRSLWMPDDLIEIRPLPVDKGKRRWVLAKDIPNIALDLERENKGGANLFAGVLPRAAEGLGSANDCLDGMVAWADMDHCSVQDAIEKVRSTKLPRPTLVVNSGHGVHLYWRFSVRVTTAILCDLVADLGEMLDSDNVDDPPRILRIPGFTNWKEPVSECAIVSRCNGVYDFDKFRALVPKALPEMDEVPFPPAEPEVDHVYEVCLRKLERVPPCGEGERDNRAFRLAAYFLKDHALSTSQTYDLMCKWNATNSPPMSETELKKCLRNAAAYGKSPVGSRVPTDAPAVIATTPTVKSSLRQEFEAEEEMSRRALKLPWEHIGVAINQFRPGSSVILAGPPGHGKTWMALQIAIHAHDLGESFAYLPLEGTTADYERRVLAFLSNNWAPLDSDASGSAYRLELLNQYEKQLGEIVQGVWDNPRKIVEVDGREELSEIRFEAVAKWVQERVVDNRLVIVDPLSYIDPESGTDEWQQEARFCRRITAIAQRSQSTVVLVAHTKKRTSGDNSGFTQDDLAGAAAFSRLADIVLILGMHENKWSDVKMPGGVMEIEHDRTVYIAKTRWGAGALRRIACTMRYPGLEERGVIVRKARKQEGKA